MKIFQFNKYKIDVILLLSVIALVVLGLIFVYSASNYTAKLEYGDPFHYLIKQSIAVLVGIVGMTLATFVNLDLLKKLALPIAAISVVLLGLVFVNGIGVENYGARRWIGFGGFTIQPSEIAKFAFVLFAATYMASPQVNMSKFCQILPVLGLGVTYCGLIILEPNMSITMVMGLLMLATLFLGGMRIKHFILMLIPFAAAVPVLILAEPYRIQRLLAFINPWASPKDEGYQLIQSLYSLGSGGWFGVGIGNSRQKYKFLPFAESDFIFSIIGEEIGLIGATFVIGLFCLVVWRGIVLAANSPNKFGCYLSGGITAVIAIQVLINLAVVTGSIPPTGLPLPFISYGGTSIVVFMTATGLLLNISKKVYASTKP